MSAGNLVYFSGYYKRARFAGSSEKMERPEKIVWTDALSIGNAAVDKDHKKLFDIYNELVNLIQQNKGRREFARILSEMTDYARIHFGKEENYMEAFSYPEFAGHRKSHLAYIHKVAMYNVNFTGHHPPDPVDVVKFLKAWWMNHILSDDMEYENHKITVGSNANYK